LPKPTDYHGNHTIQYIRSTICRYLTFILRYAGAFFVSLNQNVYYLNLKQFLLYISLMLLVPISSYATHNRSGSITFEHVAGNTYRFTVTTCTQTSSEADRPELEIDWGDGTKDTLLRDNIDYIADYDVQINTYIGLHTFTGPSSYIISVEDPNRNADVINITNSVDKVFCIQTELIISPFMGTPNNSIIIEDCPCPEFACVNEIYCYNLSAYDPDGDSLSYSLVPCRGVDCLEMSIPTIYKYPNDIGEGGGTISIDPVTGTMCWDRPIIQGEYNIAIKISEYRNGQYIGAVLQDMQFDVRVCPHDAPEIEPPADICVYAGEEIDLPIKATDSSNELNIFATGAVFYLDDNPATFVEDYGFLEVEGRFQWTPGCNEASNSPYIVTIHSDDFHPVIQLSDVKSFSVKVNIPPVENLTVNPIGNSMELSWDPSVCEDIAYYKIYKSLDSSTYENECCDLGTPGLMGYTLIDTSHTPDYIDEDDLIVGNKYCYLVTAVSVNETESCVSNQDCANLKFEIPVLTNVSVNTTDPSIGSDSIVWAYPKELDSIVFPGPYTYELYRSNGYDYPSELVYSSDPQTSIINPDTIFVDTDLNTLDLPYTYRVSLLSDGNEIGTSSPASSIYINLIPNDNQLEITWTEAIPWVNYQYEIYKEEPTESGVFNLLAIIDTVGYIDTGLVNGNTYCYKVKTIGEYTSEGIINPIVNWSQEQCGVPTDLTPPCPPVIQVSGDCDLEETYLNWTNPNNSCADDVTRYNLYFSPFEGDSLELLTTFDSQFDTSYIHKDRGSIAGCYYVTALDSIEYNNESLPSNIVCIDNCEGYYELPNIFTPNGSGVNDLYHPLLPIKFVDSIDIVIVNRWGTTVFETSDPLINWDGTDQKTGDPCSAGVYFYTIVVYEIKLAGLVPRAFQGNIQLINRNGNTD
jgi:gliding motility-associated-like protein